MGVEVARHCITIDQIATTSRITLPNRTTQALLPLPTLSSRQQAHRQTLLLELCRDQGGLQLVSLFSGWHQSAGSRQEDIQEHVEERLLSLFPDQLFDLVLDFPDTILYQSFLKDMLARLRLELCSTVGYLDIAEQVQNQLLPLLEGCIADMEQSGLCLSRMRSLFAQSCSPRSSSLYWRQDLLNDVLLSLLVESLPWLLPSKCRTTPRADLRPIHRFCNQFCSIF